MCEAGKEGGEEKWKIQQAFFHERARALYYYVSARSCGGRGGDIRVDLDM
jgi:hypothetical protein